MSTKKDPLDLAGLEPASIADAIDAKKVKIKPPSELDLKKEERLASKEKRLAGTAAKPAATPAIKDDIFEVDKSALLDQLGLYRERFPHLKRRNNVSVKSSVEDIYDELHYIEMQLGSKQDGSFGAMLLTGTMVAIEAVHRDIWNPLGLNLNGLAQVTRDNMSEFQPIVDELMIKYGAGMYMGPEMRLCLSVGAMMMTVHAANSGDPRVAVALEKMNASVKVPKGAEEL